MGVLNVSVVNDISHDINERNACFVVAELNDMFSCLLFRTLLDEMCGHDASWPFLLPVSPKECPTYRKVIKRPMDLQTMRTKIESGV